jgi:quercetin dioxygenase-like cupin family protein
MTMFYKHDARGYKRAAEGVKLKTLVHGEKPLLAEFQLEKGSRLPRHGHPHEQTGYLINGRIRLYIGDVLFEAEPGDSWCIPAHAEHRAEVVTDSVAVEVFSPVREDYLSQNGS